MHHPAITTTHAIPQSLPKGPVYSEDVAVRCRYCLTVLGVALDVMGREEVLRKHTCKAKRLNMRPAASIPFN